MAVGVDEAWGNHVVSPACDHILGIGGSHVIPCADGVDEASDEADGTVGDVARLIGGQ